MIHNRRDYLLRAATAEEKLEWTQIIKKVIKQPEDPAPPKKGLLRAASLKQLGVADETPETQLP